MNVSKFFLLFTVLVISFSFNSKKKKTLPDICLSNEEKKLVDAINNYRTEMGLPLIPLSISLTYVAQSHVKDLHFNRPAASASCNMHSWSSSRKWSECCYDKQHTKKTCMWNKPKELTNYDGIGFELTHGYGQFEEFKGDTVNAEGALKGWKSSIHHNNVLINKKDWSKTEWNAMGVGIYKDFACLWLGRENDPESKTFSDCQ